MIKLFNNYKINFTSKFKITSIISLSAIFFGILFFIFKGPQLGIDFKGGTEIIIDLEAYDSNDLNIRTEISSLLSKNNINYSNIKSYGPHKIQILSDFEIMILM